MIFIAGGTLAFFFELLLLSKKNKLLFDKILSFWMFIFGLHLFSYYFYTRELYLDYPHLLGLAIPLPLIHGPLLFLYTGSLMRYFTKWKPKYLIHFLPIIIFNIFFFDFYIPSGQEKIKILKNLFENSAEIYKIYYPAVLLSGFTYIFLTYLLFRKHRRNILNNFSNSNEKNNLHWLRNLLIGLLIIWLVVLFGNFMINSSLTDTTIYISVTIFVAFIGFFGLRQGNIFVNFPNSYLETDLIFAGQKRYSKSGLKEERAAEIQHLLVQLMEEKKLFLDENISLPQLASMVNIHPNYLSQVINEKFQKNFYDFINSYRVEEFKNLVTQGKHKKKTFYSLLLDCGFNSKASFNHSFKKKTGITPSEFVKSL
jgi:AraC-like DNA-binding protein